jgi:hypothetical protein
VLFIGIELTMEALWESSASLIWCEWTVVAGTTLACTFIGFAPGIGVGLAIVVILQFWHHLCETVGYCVHATELTLTKCTAAPHHAAMRQRTNE